MAIMPFTERIDFEFGRAYKHGNFECGDLGKYFTNKLDELNEKEKYCFFIGLLWKNGDDRVIDLECYPVEAKNNWQKNYELADFAYISGVWKIVSGWTCGDGKILFGREEENRRQTKSLEEFARSPLELGFINSLLNFKS